MPGQDNTVHHGAMGPEPIEGTKGEPVVEGLSPEHEQAFKERIARLQKQVREEEERGLVPAFNDGVYASAKFFSDLLAEARASGAPPAAAMDAVERITNAALRKAVDRQLGAMIKGDRALAKKLVEAELA